MGEFSTKFKPQFKGDKNPRKNILKLGQKITNRIGKVTSEDPEYWGLAPICSDEMCDILLKMKVRKPYTLNQLVKLTGKDPKYLEDLFQEMGVIGLIEYNWENEKKEKQYVLPLFVPGIAEFTNMNPKQIEEHPDLAMFFERMAFEPLSAIAPFVPEGGAGIGMHVIPVEKAIEMENNSVSVEHISHWLDKYEGKYACGVCSCRVSKKTQGTGVPDDENKWCIGVGDMADYVVQTNKGQYITKEEVLEIIKKAEDNGFVHQITNIDGEDKIFAICNCNPTVCYGIRCSQLFNTPNLSRSAYVAHVDKKNCVACGKCVEVCPAGALKLGQKLCTSKGEVKYPKQPLPDKLNWGEDKWNYNYRNTNKENCHLTGTAPCKTVCPAHIAVQGYLKLASQGKFKEALALIKKDNPFPAVCGRICNKRCEDACTRSTIDEAVSIDAVKKFVSDLDLKSDSRYIPNKVIPKVDGEFSEKIAIIGAGPAGLSCAYYLALTGYRPVVFEKNSEPGGMLTYGIPSYKLQKDVIQAEIEVLKELGVEIKCNVEVGKDVTIDELRKQGFKAFYLAIGLSKGNVMKVEGYEGSNVFNAIDILHLANDEQLKLTGDVVVIGGGNVAIDASRVSVRLTNNVTMVSLEERQEMPASESEILEAIDEGVNLVPGYGLSKILRENGNIVGVELVKCVSVFDNLLKFNPQYDLDNKKVIKCSNVIFAIGQKAEFGDLLKNSKVQINNRGLVRADKVTYQTDEEDIFVGGDLYVGPSFAIDAIAMGREGAVSLHRYVQNKGDLVTGRNLRVFYEMDKDDVIIESYDKAGRAEDKMDESIDYRRSFKDAHLTLTEEQVLQETKRCLGCGAVIVDQNKCIGCGLCTTRCEFDAIKLHRDHPNCSRMEHSDNAQKLVLKNMIKRSFKIAFSKKTLEEKEEQRKHRAYKKAKKVKK
ncbi:MAG: FAD-dependent oxidoreductase [Bacilli bacterium]|nr:FAD-dependent oxidoreductase [Bacilli bacterium]